MKKSGERAQIIALAGNPNVGKSTVFNALTGLHQHTGNWPGKTVDLAQGSYLRCGKSYTLVDLPGTYSLTAHSAEEAVARDFIAGGEADCVVVVCDGACLERNLNLVLQILELTPNVIVCVNLLDEAERRGITVDLPRLSRILDLPVVGTAATGGEGLDRLAAEIARVTETPPQTQREQLAPEEKIRLAEK
ncbi:MAG: FeoB small GTPase domain-containing protein, partial [Pseudoflavonifractor sp.]